MEPCDAIDIIAYIEGIDPDGKTRDHIENCPACSAEKEKYTKLLRGLLTFCQTETLPDPIDREASMRREELPSVLKERVAARKKKWLAGQTGKVIDFHDPKGKDEKAADIKKILQQDVSDLPKAASPDDLTGGEEGKG